MEQKNLNEMKWEKVEAKTNFVILEAGQEVTGIYLGSEPSINFPESKNHKIEVEGQVKFMSGVVLDSRLATIKAGTPIKIVSMGKPRGKRYTDYEVYTSKV